MSRVKGQSQACVLCVCVFAAIPLEWIDCSVKIPVIVQRVKTSKENIMVSASSSVNTCACECKCLICKNHPLPNNGGIPSDHTSKLKLNTYHCWRVCYKRTEKMLTIMKLPHDTSHTLTLSLSLSLSPPPMLLQEELLYIPHLFHPHL